ncbi:MAG: hypothetical protein JXA33_19810 [Anaerolineae bacterium]|nr:hypothetical protein [Anaerolineae bacterium]
MFTRLLLETLDGHQEEAITLSYASLKYHIKFRTLQAAARRNQLLTYRVGRSLLLTTGVAIEQWLSQRREPGRPANCIPQDAI